MLGRFVIIWFIAIFCKHFVDSLKCSVKKNSGLLFAQQIEIKNLTDNEASNNPKKKVSLV